MRVAVAARVAVDSLRLMLGRLSPAGVVLEQMAAQEVELRGDDRLVLAEEGGVVRAVDLKNFASGRPAGGLQTWRRQDGLVARADHR